MVVDGMPAVRQQSDTQNGELIQRPSTGLAWNQLSGPYFFHYTDRAAARAIMADKVYDVGERHPKSPGLYVTQSQPGELSDEALLNAIFDGMRDIERTQAAVVLTDAPLQFTRVGEKEWCHSAPAGARLLLTSQIVGWAAIEGGLWRYSPSLYAS
jgi:hypothetical protein